MIRIMNDKEKINNIIKDYKNNLQINKISLKYNISVSTTFKILKENKVFKYKTIFWSNEEINILKKYYPCESWEKLLELLPNREKNTIIYKASKLKIKRKVHRWLKADILILKKLYESDLSIEEIAKRLNNKFTKSAIITKANKLRLIRSHRWEEWEINYLKKHYNNTSLDEICNILRNRKRKSIITFCTEKLNLLCMTSWTKEEDEIIKNNYLNYTDYDISKMLCNRSEKSVVWRRLTLDLKRPMKTKFGQGSIDKYGNIFYSKDERKVFEYIKSIDMFKYIKAIGSNHQKQGKYAFNITDTNINYKVFYPDFVIEYININNNKILLDKPLILEYYGIYNKKRKNNKVINNYRYKTKIKDKYYKNNKDIYYIGIIPKDLHYHYKKLNDKLNAFYYTNINKQKIFNTYQKDI